MSKDFSTYNALDFAQEDSFIQWVKILDEEAEVFWTQWLKDHPEKEEIIEEAKRLVLSIRVEEPQIAPQQIQALWDRIDEGIEAEVIPIKQSNRSIIRWIGYAAAACIAALLIFVFYPSSTTVIANKGTLLTYELPDGSSVQLNADSKLSLNKKNWEENRAVELNGEAFFEVKKGNTFRVITPNGQVEVLGTSFNVYARSSALEVDCFTGKVRVASKSAAEKILTKGQGTRLLSDKALSETITIDTLERATWRVGQFHFKKVPLLRVLEEIERQFDLDMEIEAKNIDREVEVYFENTTVDSALYRATWPFELSFERKDKIVIIRE